ncbi:lysine N(6)-hydroxylase/L-ornithine N(5)-oxygenase family protein [Paenibacillus sp. YYML68]|uniref:lysine N(6)-hydroxylase/L-ornithine N(5)-oxygenase family protein n=1 Tax=Paenibacillus sp. YYML68 TaxID=2909250 RepID=UPI00248FBC2C|nr:lysine N(6)-hydroxylase/L-ornithine N(5)-oxygenase family protein [Paenibacillus sp. YYML68]
MANETRNVTTTVDLLGIGIGPFNLGLAALLQRVPEVEAVFLERQRQFAWHPGMMVEGTTLQVPFFADLVTMADPTHPLSFLSYLHQQGRLYHFYFLEKFHITRKEYSHYCEWAAKQLASCRFGIQAESVTYAPDRGVFLVETQQLESGERTSWEAKNVVLGVGSTPAVPAPFRSQLGPRVLHSSAYMPNRAECLASRSITVIGSGQSAAEIVLDLIRRQSEHGYRVDWFTRSEGFFPMEYSKLGLEHFSPDYTSYFYNLPAERRDELRRRQGLLYKGISARTIADIYDALYEAGEAGGSASSVRLLACTEVQGVERCGEAGPYRLHCRHLQQETSFVHESDTVILATGYEHAEPACLASLEPYLQRDSLGRLDIEESYAVRLDPSVKGRLFIQNGELHTHGVGAPDLGLGAYRSSVIINQLAGREVYRVQERHVFQQFGVGR